MRSSRHGGALGNHGTWVYSPDSSQAVLNLNTQNTTGEKDGCAELEHLHAGLCGQERAALKKAGWLRVLNKPVLSRIEVSLPPAGSAPETPALLIVLQGHDSTADFRYRRVGGVAGDMLSPWCDDSRGCLTSPAPHLPLAQGRLMDSSSEELVSRWHSSLSKVFPVLPGIVVGMDSMGPRNYQVTLYHGNELYSTYASLGDLDAGLKSGALVDPSRSIGEAALADSMALPQIVKNPSKKDLKKKSKNPSAPVYAFEYGLAFSVEQAGMPVDPVEFFASPQGTDGTPNMESTPHGP